MASFPGVVMRWLTREWHAGGEESLCSGADYEQAVADYLAHNARVRPLLPAPLRVFAPAPDDRPALSLHDARVEEWQFQNSDSALHLQLICGDLQVGYSRVLLTYSAAELFGATVEQLQQWLDDGETEFLYDEIDTAQGGRFEHRFLLWPKGEFGVRFSAASVESAPVEASAYNALSGYTES